MPTLREWIVEQAEGEPIEAVVLGHTAWGNDYGSDRIPCYSEQPKDKVLSWEEAQPFIDYEFDSGYGSPSCNPIAAWTKSWVIAIYQYDGATGPFRLPRNPIAHEPEMPGG